LSETCKKVIVTDVFDKKVLSIRQPAVDTVCVYQRDAKSISNGTAVPVNPVGFRRERRMTAETGPRASCCLRVTWRVMATAERNQIAVRRTAQDTQFSPHQTIPDHPRSTQTVWLIGRCYVTCSRTHWSGLEKQ